MYCYVVDSKHQPDQLELLHPLLCTMCTDCSVQKHVVTDKWGRVQCVAMILGLLVFT